MTNKVKPKTSLECDLIQRGAEAKSLVMSPGAFLHCVWYGLIERLAYLRMVNGCKGGGALLHAPLDLIKLWYVLGICRLIWDMAVDPVLVLVATGRLTETDWKVLKN